MTTRGDDGGGGDGPFAALSREVALACDGDGTVTWVDDRARRVLGARPGTALASLAAPGMEPKVLQLIAQARARAVTGWELALMVRGAPATVAFDAAPHDGGVALVGSLLPEHYGAALARVAATMSELAALHRETSQQRAELAHRHAELLKLHSELHDSDKGVMALHAELDVQAATLHRVTESRTTVVATVSHEFRTPVNSILGLSQILLSEDDGPLTPEQTKQVQFIRKSAEALSTLANDLLDLSKLDAGKLTLRATTLAVTDLFAALRGMLRPIAGNDAVALVFEEPDPALQLRSDEGKIAQILRNLVSNALKFTERGEVRIAAAAGPDDTVNFTVADTGIGIAPRDQLRIFDEFTQIEGPLQAKVKGTGLGLSLSRKLADLLGGELAVQSEVGRGSTFTLTIPRVHPDEAELAELTARSARLDPSRAPVLVVEDDRQTLFLYEKYLEGSGFQVIPVRTIDEARQTLRRLRPAAIVLDVMLEGESTWAFLTELKGSPDTRDIPALIVTVTDREDKARALGADEFVVKPIGREWLVTKLVSLARTSPVEKVLVIDDDPIARYLVRKLLAGLPYTVLEAADGPEGLRVAREERPQVIFLDFVMPEMSAFEVLDELKRDPVTRCIPVIINTSENLSAEERGRLASDTAAILSKQSLSREVAIARVREALVTAGLRPAPRG